MVCVSSQKGEAAVSLLMARLLESQISVLRPICDTDSAFDLVIYVDSTFYRLQVKRAQANKRNAVGSYVIPLRKINHNTKSITTYKYSGIHTDFVVGVVVETNDFYCFPISLVDQIGTTVTVSPKNSVISVRNRKFNHEDYHNKITLGNATLSLK